MQEAAKGPPAPRKHCTATDLGYSHDARARTAAKMKRGARLRRLGGFGIRRLRIGTEAAEASPT